tara:strand:- start:5544 stop:6215 length:672 start_codon:yes stop_codon:yes gene_type:complete
MLESLNLRINMVNNQLKPCGINNQSILNIFSEVPRELFLSYGQEANFYSDNIVFFSKKKKIENRYMLSPSIFARMLQIAEIKAEEKVLDIGCLTGYSTVVLSKLCKNVVGIDNDQDLIDTAIQSAKKMEAKNIKFHLNSLKKGCPSGSKYDLIFINGAVDFIPDELEGQLTKNGRLVCIFFENKIGRVCVFKKSSQATDKINFFEVSVPHITKDFKEKSVFSF